jgi:hypothetical protein
MQALSLPVHLEQQMEAISVIFYNVVKLHCCFSVTLHIRALKEIWLFLFPSHFLFRLQMDSIGSVLKIVKNH